MNVGKSLFCLLGLLVGLPFAQESINVSGRIVASDSTGLSGCVIELHNLTAVTSTSGDFTLTGNVGVDKVPSKSRSLPLSLKAFLLSFQITSLQAEVNIGIEDLQGRRLATLRKEGLTPGIYESDLRSALAGCSNIASLSAAKLCLVRCRIDGQEAIFKLPLIGAGHSLSTSSPASSLSSRTSLAKVAAVNDTIVIRCKGYLPHKAPVTSYSGSVGTIKIKKPNIVFLMADDMNKWTTMTGSQIKTPNLEKLAKSGVYFTNAHTSAQECCPARTSLMTGLRPSTSGMYWNSHNFRTYSWTKNLVTLPQYLQKFGYETVGVGKIFHTPSGPFCDSASWNTIIPYNSTIVPTRYQTDPWHHGDLDGYMGGALVFGPCDEAKEQTGDYRGAKFTADYLLKPHDKPFFIACGNFRPHAPLVAPKEYFDMYPLSGIKTPDTLLNDLADCGPIGVSFAHSGNVNTQAVVIKWDKWKEALQGYMACVSFVDANMGMVLDALDKSVYRDNTIVFFLPDHGVHLGTKHHWWKVTLWQETTHIPFIVRVPGMTPAGARSDRAFDFTAVYPTIVELLGLPVKDSLDGRSIVPLLRKPDTLWDYASVTTCGEGNHAVVTEKFRFIRYKDSFEELYVKTSDSLEFYNVAKQSTYAADLVKLRSFLPKVNRASP